VIKINLAPEEGRRRPALQLSLPGFNLGLVFGVVYLVAVAGAGLYWFSLAHEESRLQAEVARDQQELTSLKATIGQGARVKDQLADMQKRAAAIVELAKNQGRPMALLDVFLDAVPQDLWITALEEKTALVKVSGTAFSTTAVSDFMTNLRKSGRFKDVDIVIARQDLNKSPRPVTFEVTCRFEI
jgi:Tfp pilus assembly protein PilN